MADDKGGHIDAEGAEGVEVEPASDSEVDRGEAQESVAIKIQEIPFGAVEQVCQVRQTSQSQQLLQALPHRQPQKSDPQDEEEGRAQ